MAVGCFGRRRCRGARPLRKTDRWSVVRQRITTLPLFACDGLCQTPPYLGPITAHVMADDPDGTEPTKRFPVDRQQCSLFWGQPALNWIRSM